VLEGRDMGPVSRDAIGDVIGNLVDEYTPGDYIEEWDLDELWAQLDQIFQVDFGPDELDRESIDRDGLKELLVEDAQKLYDERETELGAELMRALERYLLLQIIDQRWREHLYDMDYLREGIHLRGFAQIEPLVAYKNEAFTLFRDLMNTIWADFARMIYNVEVEVEGENGNGAAESLPSAGSQAAAILQYSGGSLDDQPNAYGGDVGAYGVDADDAQEPAIVQQRRVDENEQIGRNDPCWCGSGKKYKKCHGA
jgi:preprotein translocase subunit SecA